MIPKIIHQCYFPSSSFYEWPLDREETLARYEKNNRALSDTWIKNNPDFVFALWTYDNIGALLPENEIQERALRLIKSEIIYTLKSDLCRVLLLCKFGGIYADTDFYCRKSFSPLLETSSFCAREREGGAFASSLMGAVKGGAVLADCLETTVNVIEGNRGNIEKSKYNILNCGFFLASVFLSRFETILPTEFFFPYFCTERGTGPESYINSYAVHLWHSGAVGGWVDGIPVGDPELFTGRDTMQSREKGEK